MICTPHRIFFGYSNREERDGLSTYHVWGEERFTQVFVGNLKERDHLEDPDIDGRIILKWIFRKWGGGKDWICVAQNRGRWRTLVNAVMFHRVS